MRSVSVVELLISWNMFVEVESNPNCEQSVCARFKDVGQRRPVVQIRSDERTPGGEWYWVTGWTDDPAHPCCPAFAQVVEDSGAGAAHLIIGGIWGIRLKPVALSEEWDVDSPNQWGEPYLLLANARDLRYADTESR
jgi:hypothetical protein